MPSLPPLGERACSVARTLDLVGDRWTLLILRDVALGISRFEAIQRNLEVSRRALTERLRGLEANGVIERRAYSERPPRHDYMLTEKGADLAAVLLVMQAWGDKWMQGDDAPPISWHHATCDHAMTPVVCCEHCREPIAPGSIIPVLAPGHEPGTGGPEMAPAVSRLRALLGA